MLPINHHRLRCLSTSSLLLLSALFFSSCACPTPGYKVESAVKCLRSAFEDKEEKILSVNGREIPINVTKGSGNKPVLLLHELNGQSPGCLELADQLARKGCKVYVPRYYADFGSDIRPGKTWAQVTFSPCWKLFSKTGGTALSDSEAIADFVKKRHRGQRVTVIGNCMTGGHALALLARPEVGTAVVCQPAAPVFPYSGARRQSFGIPEEKVTASMEALHKDKRKKLVSFNYLEDAAAPIGRTYHLARLADDAKAADRHFIRIGAREVPRSLPLPKESRYSWIPTKAKGIGDQHPTITSAPESDVDRFRDALYPILGL